MTNKEMAKFWQKYFIVQKKKLKKKRSLGKSDSAKKPIDIHDVNIANILVSS